MTFKELKELLYWACDDGTNSDDLLFLRSGYDGRLINEALRDLADCLRIVRYDDSLFLDESGVVVLPPDFMSALRVRYGETDLTQVDSAFDLAIGSGAVTQYMFVGRNSIQLYDTPRPPYSTIHLWYTAYPPELSNDDDEPSDVPAEYHEALATVYGKAQFYKKFGNLAAHQQLTALWQLVKRDVRLAVASRTAQADHRREWRW